MSAHPAGIPPCGAATAAHSVRRLRIITSSGRKGIIRIRMNMTPSYQGKWLDPQRERSPASALDQYAHSENHYSIPVICRRSELTVADTQALRNLPTDGSTFPCAATFAALVVAALTAAPGSTPAPWLRRARSPSRSHSSHGISRCSLFWMSRKPEVASG